MSKAQRQALFFCEVLPQTDNNIPPKTNIVRGGVSPLCTPRLITHLKVGLSLPLSEAQPTRQTLQTPRLRRSRSIPAPASHGRPVAPDAVALTTDPTLRLKVPPAIGNDVTGTVTASRSRGRRTRALPSPRGWASPTFHRGSQESRVLGQQVRREHHTFAWHLSS